MILLASEMSMFDYEIDYVSWIIVHKLCNVSYSQIEKLETK